MSSNFWNAPLCRIVDMWWQWMNIVWGTMLPWIYLKVHFTLSFTDGDIQEATITAYTLVASTIGRGEHAKNNLDWRHNRHENWLPFLMFFFIQQLHSLQPQIAIRKGQIANEMFTGSNFDLSSNYYVPPLTNSNRSSVCETNFIGLGLRVKHRESYASLDSTLNKLY